MIQATHAAKGELPKPILPKWIFDASAPETLEMAGFAIGSALALVCDHRRISNDVRPAEFERFS